jgi:hypothetical protein
MFVQSKEFPETPFDSISSHSGPVPFLNDQTQSVVFELVDGDTDTEVRRSEPAAVPLDLGVFRRVMQPLVGPEPMVARAATRRFGSVVGLNPIPVGPQTVNRFRPFARRRLMTSRPAFVDMRSRKPCVRFRFKLLG